MSIDVGRETRVGSSSTRSSSLSSTGTGSGGGDAFFGFALGHLGRGGGGLTNRRDTGTPWFGTSVKGFRGAGLGTQTGRGAAADCPSLGRGFECFIDAPASQSSISQRLVCSAASCVESWTTPPHVSRSEWQRSDSPHPVCPWRDASSSRAPCEFLAHATKRRVRGPCVSLLEERWQRPATKCWVDERCLSESCTDSVQLRCQPGGSANSSILQPKARTAAAD
jgi:hypothetical protein